MHDKEQDVCDLHSYVNVRTYVHIVKGNLEAGHESRSEVDYCY